MIKLRVCLCGILLLTLAACDANISDTLAPNGTTNIRVPADGTIGQSFVARHAGLQSIELYLSADGEVADIQLTLHLRRAATLDMPDVRLATLNLHTPAQSAWYRFAFEPLPESHDQSYYFFVEAKLPATALLHSTQLPNSAYRDGALYLNQRAQDAQLAFRASYSLHWVALDLVAYVAQSVFTTFAFVIVFVMPGLALQTYWLPLASWRVRIMLAAALSLGVYPIVLLWAQLVGVSLGVLAVVLPVGLSLCALAWRALTHRAATRLVRPPFHWANLTWWCLAVLLLSVRLFILRAVDAPMLGDSVQHAVIAQLLLDHGGLFDSWQPYAPYSTLTVHYGFHSAVAVFAWLTHASLLDAMLLVGQWINVIAILTLSLLAERVSRNSWAGVGALLIAGLLSPMPNEYVNWGRYPQLLGQAWVPVACWLVWCMFDGESHPRVGLIVLTSISFAGTFLSYYGSSHYILLFVLVRSSAHVMTTLQQRHSPVRSLCLLGCAGALALLMILPWLLHIRGGNLATYVANSVTQGTTLEGVINEYQIFTSLGQYVPLPLVLAASLVTLWALWRRERAVLIVALWCSGIVLLPASSLLRLPGANNLQGFAIIISLYMPVGVLVGSGIDRLLAIASQSNRMTLVGALMALSVFALLGAWQQLSVINPDERILAPADERAMQWIEANVARDAQFLVDGFLIFSGVSVVGSDGGWWLPLLAHRRNTMPPQYPLLFERPNDSRYNDWVVGLVTQLRKVGVTSREGIELLCRDGITHVYVGEEQGHSGIPPPEPMLHLGELERSSAFTTLYRQDKVGVFALNESACQ